MFDKVSETVKFFIFLTIYTVAIAYWAGDLTANLEAQTTNLNAQTELLQVHIKECKDRSVVMIRLEEDVRHLNIDVSGILDRERRANGTKAR